MEDENKYVDVLDMITDDDVESAEELPDTEDPTKPFKFEYAHESITESSTRFRERRAN